MTSLLKQLNQNGFLILESVLPNSPLEDLRKNLISIGHEKAGTRNLLHNRWCIDLANSLKVHPSLKGLLPDKAVAVQCTYFMKSVANNWLVPPHRDQFIPVRKCLNRSGWSAWSTKEGLTFVRPPQTVLESLVSVRFHVDDNSARNGPLEVVPKSHIDEGVNTTTRVPCYVRRGGVLVFKPLLLHTSSKVLEGQRRVLHFLYAPPKLPDGLEWAIMV